MKDPLGDLERMIEREWTAHGADRIQRSFVVGRKDVFLRLLEQFRDITMFNQNTSSSSIIINLDSGELLACVDNSARMNTLELRHYDLGILASVTGEPI